MQSFIETQRMPYKWIVVIPGGLAVLFGVAVVQQVGFGIPFGAKPAGNAVLVLLLAAMLLLIAGLLAIRLTVKIDAAGIAYRFFPFQRKWQVHPWHSIADVYVRDYKAMYEYGGWGLKGMANDRAVTVSGSRGLQLVFKTGQKLLLGTRAPERVEEVVKVFRKVGGR
jgi:hypothetical protein